MKIDCGLSPLTKARIKEAARKKEFRALIVWHSYFAILPVRIGDNHCRWLETVERKLELVDTHKDFIYWEHFGNRCDNLFSYRVKK